MNMSRYIIWEIAAFVNESLFHQWYANMVAFFNSRLKLQYRFFQGWLTIIVKELDIAFILSQRIIIYSVCKNSWYPESFILLNFYYYACFF